MECDRYMNYRCVGSCPYEDDAVIYCNDCEYSEEDCSECYYFDTPDCKERE